MVKDWLGTKKKKERERKQVALKNQQIQAADIVMQKNMQAQHQPPINNDLHSVWNRDVKLLS